MPPRFEPVSHEYSEVFVPTTPFAYEYGSLAEYILFQLSPASVVCQTPPEPAAYASFGASMKL